MGKQKVVAPKPKTFKVLCPLYSNSFLVVTGVPYNVADKKFCKEYGFEYEPEPEGQAAGRFVNWGSKDGLIWFQDAKPTGSVVAHEAFHATVHTMLKSGVKFCNESDEAFAYMLGWLVKEIGQRVWT